MVGNRTVRWTTATGVFYLWCFWWTCIVRFCVASSVDVESSIAEALQLVEAVRLDADDTTATANKLESLDRQLQTSRTEIEQIQQLKEQKKGLLQSINTKRIDAWIQTLKDIQGAELKRRATPERAVQYDEDEVYRWILDLIDEQVERLENSDRPNNNHSKAACLTKTQAVQHLHTALRDYADDGIGRTDLLQRPNVRIVHSRTSPTYQLAYYDSAWMKYIPEDWEPFLPDRLFTHPNMAPPETILEKTVHPGSCWATLPWNAKITVQLPSPTYIEAISVDHVSESLVDLDRSSAPKTVKVYGYESPQDDEPAVYLTTLMYDLEGRQVQTFPIATDPTTDTDDDEQESASCSAVSDTPSCGVLDPTHTAIAVVKFEIVDNWGHPEYTCVYRLRVHGQAVSTQR